jgi:ribonuclease P protein component
VFRFPRKERLKSRTVIKKLFKQGLRHREGPVFVLYQFVETAELAVVKSAFSVPKRRISKAADRNLIKRRMREAYRLSKFRLCQKAIERNCHVNLLFVWSDSSILAYINIRESIGALCDRLEDSL